MTKILIIVRDAHCCAGDLMEDNTVKGGRQIFAVSNVQEIIKILASLGIRHFELNGKYWREEPHCVETLTQVFDANGITGKCSAQVSHGQFKYHMGISLEGKSIQPSDEYGFTRMQVFDLEQLRFLQG